MKRLFGVFVLLGIVSSITFGQDLTFDAGVKPHAGMDAVYAKFSKAYRELDH